jgi:bacterioferritin-associated ferredoxin
MIICSCSGITDRDILQAIDWMRAADPHALITPGKVYRALGKSADCGGCIRLFVENMRQCDKLRIPAAPRDPRGEPEEGARHEGRQGGHRVPQQGAAQ